MTYNAIPAPGLSRTVDLGGFHFHYLQRERWRQGRRPITMRNLFIHLVGDLWGLCAAIYIEQEGGEGGWRAALEVGGGASPALKTPR